MAKIPSDKLRDLYIIQHKIFVCEIILKNAISNTQNEINKLVQDKDIVRKLDTYQDELNSLISDVDEADLVETFQDNYYLMLPENKFTYQMQKEATKEVIGQEFAIEEVIETYG